MRLFVLLALTALVAACVARHGVAAPPPTKLEVQRGAPNWLVRDAYRFARWLEDPVPRAIRITYGKWAVVAMRGQFVCAKSCSYPPGARPPRGTYARYVIDPRTRGVVSFALRP